MKTGRVAGIFHLQRAYSSGSIMLLSLSSTSQIIRSPSVSFRMRYTSSSLTILWPTSVMEPSMLSISRFRILSVQITRATLSRMSLIEVNGLLIRRRVRSLTGVSLLKYMTYGTMAADGAVWKTRLRQSLNMPVLDGLSSRVILNSRLR